MMRPSRQRPRRGFVLLEVLVSLMILSIALTAIMRSFTQSLNGVRLMEVQTQAQFFAMRLMHELEVNPPDEGSSSGDFGENFKDYSYTVDVHYEQPKYGRMDGVKDVDRFFPMRQVTITINYNSPKLKRVIAPLVMDTAIVGFEKLSAQTKTSYGYY